MAEIESAGGGGGSAKKKKSSSNTSWFDNFLAPVTGTVKKAQAITKQQNTGSTGGQQNTSNAKNEEYWKKKWYAENAHLFNQKTKSSKSDGKSSGGGSSPGISYKKPKPPVAQDIGQQSFSDSKYGGQGAPPMGKTQKRLKPVGVLDKQVFDDYRAGMLPHALTKAVSREPFLQQVMTKWQHGEQYIREAIKAHGGDVEEAFKMIFGNAESISEEQWPYIKKFMRVALQSGGNGRGQRT